MPDPTAEQLARESGEAIANAIADGLEAVLLRLADAVSALLKEQAELRDALLLEVADREALSRSVWAVLHETRAAFPGKFDS